MCGLTQIHLATQYGHHFVDEHLMQFESESLVCFYTTGRLQRTAEDCHHVGWLPGVWITEANALWTREESFNFPVQERGAHSKRSAKKEKRKKRGAKMIQQLGGADRLLCDWKRWQGWSTGKNRFGFQSKMPSLMGKTKMAAKSQAWQSYGSNRWQAYQMKTTNPETTNYLITKILN